MTKEQRERTVRKQQIRGLALHFQHGVVPPLKALVYDTKALIRKQKSA